MLIICICAVLATIAAIKPNSRLASKCITIIYSILAILLGIYIGDCIFNNIPQGAYYV